MIQNVTQTVRGLFALYMDLRKYFFSERVVNRWNELDEDTVSATTVNMFKSRLQRIRQFKTSFYTDT